MLFLHTTLQRGLHRYEPEIFSVSPPRRASSLPDKEFRATLPFASDHIFTPLSML
ncbi:MAG: hypothetical protein HYY60_01185 [Parcubacteria group bacterium]|nr:hypothetical protein [Parcubacteria group bacterium]